MLTYHSPSCSRASYSWHGTYYLMELRKHSTKDIVRASWRPLLASNICRESFDRIPRIIHSFSRIWWCQPLCMHNDKRKYVIVKIFVYSVFSYGVIWMVCDSDFPTISSDFISLCLYSTILLLIFSFSKFTFLLLFFVNFFIICFVFKS